MLTGAGRCPSIGSNPKQHTSAVPQSCLISTEAAVENRETVVCLGWEKSKHAGKIPDFSLSLQGIMENSFTYLHTDKLGGGVRGGRIGKGKHSWSKKRKGEN